MSGTGAQNEQPEPHQYTEEIHGLAAEVWRRVQEWHDAPGWQDTEDNRRRYDLTAAAIAQLEHATRRRQPDTPGAITQLIAPILTEWAPGYAGPEQAIYAAADRLRMAVRRVS
jgi:hypothetical protein